MMANNARIEQELNAKISEFQVNFTLSLRVYQQLVE